MQSVAPHAAPLRTAGLTAYSEPARQMPKQKADPAPSRWSYKFQRLMLTPIFRFALRVGVPFTLACSLGTAYMANPERREALALTISEMYSSIQTRPEFMVQMMAIDGATGEVAAAIHEIVPVDFPISSFDLDLTHIREIISQLNPVQDADIRLQAGGVLQVTIDERQTAALWRTRDGLFRVDDEGHYIGLALDPADYPGLPLIAGEGADTAVAEAKALIAAAAPIKERVHGLVRIGERRWDVVLDRGQRILLPETGPVEALQRVIALAQLPDKVMLERDLTVVDMRLGHRPTLRLNDSAMQELWRIKTTKTDVAADQ